MAHPSQENNVSQKPRNPRHFPRMKVRGARRRQLAPWHRTAGSIDRMGEALAIAGSQMIQFTKAMNALAAIDREVTWGQSIFRTIEEQAALAMQGRTAHHD